MNTVKYQRKEEETYVQGSLFRSLTGTTIYILAMLGTNQYACVSLGDGFSWRGTYATMKEACKGLELLHTSAEITIKPIQ